jgi:hypothetical protein
MRQGWSTRTSVCIEKKNEIFKLKDKIQNTMHQRNEVVWDKDKTQITYNKSFQNL